MIQPCKIRKKTQTRTKRDKMKNTITLLLRNLIRKSKQPIVFYRYQLFKFVCLTLFICGRPLRPLITQYLAYDNKQNLTTNKGQKKKTLPISARERCRSPSSVRLLNNMTNYKRNKNRSKNWQLCTNIRKFCMKTRTTKSKKTFC